MRASTLALASLCLVVPACTALDPASVGAPSGAEAATYAPALTRGSAATSTTVVYRAVSGAVAVRQRDDQGTWTAPQYFGGTPVTAPAAVRVSGTLHLFARRADGTLWQRSGDGAWGPWHSVGGNLSSGPAAVGRSDGRLDVFARGAGDALRWVTYRPATGWGSWVSLGERLGTAPTAARTGSSGIAVCAARTDLTLACRRMTGGTWGAWESLGASTRSTPALAFDGSAGRLHLLYRALDGSIGHLSRGASWTAGPAPAGKVFDGLGARVTGTGDLLVAGLGEERNLRSAATTSAGWSVWDEAWQADPLPAPPPSLRGRVVNRIPTGERVVALTFDGGSGDQAVASVRHTLQSKRVPATTFLTGEFFRDHPTSANALATTGLRFGNHSDTHPYFTDIGDSEGVAQLATGRAEAMRVAGVESKPLFRFPYGDYAAADLAMVNREGYVAVGWTVDTLGWKGAREGITTGIVLRRVLAALEPGAIVLMHLGAAPDGTTLDADALPRVVDEVRARGYRFVTLRELVGW